MTNAELVMCIKAQISDADWAITRGDFRTAGWGLAVAYRGIKTLPESDEKAALMRRRDAEIRRVTALFQEWASDPNP